EFEARFPWTGEGPRPFRERALVHWVELSGPLRDLATGAESADFVSAALVASPAALSEQLHSTSAEVDTTAWLVFLVLAAILLDIYVIAAAVALFMIVGLSRAVNRLSRSTRAIAGGDFSVRIPVRRQDQLGELQRSFNAMAAHLEELVTTAAQKEALDKELGLARRLQQDLLPREALRLPGVQFATHFEPSAAIGGDYFDLLRMNEETLAVVIADVAGHGLPAGLRMAMLKAALQILVENGESPPATLRRLGEMVRTERTGRTFVTATLAQLHLPSGRLRLTNAGHPPTYILRDGGVEEIVLPSPPLGTFDLDFAEREIALAPGDTVVWLSDGFVETCDPGGEPFGYERIQAALAGPATSPEAVRDRLLAAVTRHGQGRPPDDDRTLVALAYRGVAPGEIPNRS
ncbi:MAG TPA: SpoIIE family protein phosphatase, partial [Thermoanaerobaculia bacterium]|nr:SpoIIE family protein phosphatase [Thermoanaerobaculia bacterium]